MMLDECSRAEITAGALALGEASEAQRQAYRRHVAGCHECLARLGGERDIERTMASIARARDDESWQPELRIVFRQPDWKRRGLTIGLATAAAFAAVWLGGRALLSTQAPAVTRVVAAVRTHVVLPLPKHNAVAGHDLIVLHHVATLKRPPLPAAPPSAVAAAPAPVRHDVVAHVAHPRAHTAAAVVAMAAPSERDERSVAALKTVGSAPPAPEHAESLALMGSGVNHDVVPLGGENAIVPRPPAIAYYENAEGTTVFDVSVDERGVAVKCSVAKSSGFLVLDDAVCAAAMRARYSPRTLNGRPVPGVYHDALTFQAGDNR